MIKELEKRDRKQEFLNAALDLFYEKGYEKTTINDIINKVEVSKGAFYHYFISKEEVIETIADEYTDKILSIVKKVVERKDINALEKLNLAIEQVQKQKKRESEKRRKIKRALGFHNDENLKLKKKISDKMSDKFTPYYQKIIDEAIEQGIFDVPKSKELAIFLLSVVQILNTSIDELEAKHYQDDKFNKEPFLKELEEKVLFYEDLFQRVFNVKRGNINIRMPLMTRY